MFSSCVLAGTRPAAVCSSSLSLRASSSSGRLQPGPPSACFSRQRRMFSWCPDSSTSGTFSPAIHLGPRVLRAIEQPVGERLLQRRLLVAERARQLPHAGVDQRHRRQLAAREHEVAERELLVHPALAAAARPRLRSARTATSGRFPRQLHHLAVIELACPAARGRSPCRRRRACTASSAFSSGSASITMPGPPPYGRSSTVR